MAGLISKSKLKAKMLQIFRELEESGEELTVTDFGRPVLRIVPIKNKAPVEKMFSEYRGRVKYYEDPDSPTQDEWLEV